MRGALLHGILTPAFIMTTALQAQTSTDAHFQTIPQAILRRVEAGELAGAVTLLAKEGKIIELDAVGKSDLHTGRAQRTDDFFWVASMTKPMTAAAILMLRDEGKLALDDPIEKYLPAFKTGWVISEQTEDRTTLHRPASAITIRQLLTHTHGLAEVPVPALGTPLEEWVNEIARAPRVLDPGKEWRYGNSSSNVLGRIVETVSGMPYQDFLRRRIFDPLGMEETTFYPNAAQLERLSKSYRHPAQGKPLEEVQIGMLGGGAPGDTRRIAAPGAGLFSTAMDIWRFYQLLLDGGRFDGKQLISAESVAEMTRVQTGDLAAGFSPGMGWGLSIGIVREPVGWTDALPTGAYGHDGAYGPTVIVEPQKRVVMIMMIQRDGLNPYTDGLKYRQLFQRAVRDALASRGN